MAGETPGWHGSMAWQDVCRVNRVCVCARARVCGVVYALARAHPSTPSLRRILSLSRSLPLSPSPSKAPHHLPIPFDAPGPGTHGRPTEDEDVAWSERE